MEEIRKGKIVGFQGSWGSGLATLIIEKPDGTVDYVHCDNAPTVRAMDSAFGNVITAGHMVDNKAIKYKEIYYSIGDFGILEGFTPVEQASPELEKMYKEQLMGRARQRLKKVV